MGVSGGKIGLQARLFNTLVEFGYSEALLGRLLGEENWHLLKSSRW